MPVWRVEFDRAAARDLRKLGIDAERRVLSYLRTRIAGSSDARQDSNSSWPVQNPGVSLPAGKA
jgi:hypothetical protein